MNQQWILINRSGHAAPLKPMSKCLMWATCLRQIAILPEGQKTEFALPTDIVLQGEKAYKYLLEIICGLHSPLAGETEVFGQFKDFCASIDWGENSELQFFKEVSLQLLIDAKKIRTKYLKGLGSQSYGSLARKWLASETDINVVGAGRLVQDILPWLAKSQVQVKLFVRDSQKVETAEWFQAYSDKVSVFNIQLAPPRAGGLLIGAPMRAGDIEEWAEGVEISRVLDLRGESETDPLQISSAVQNLKQAFEKIESTKDQVQKQSKKALQEIKDLASRVVQSQKNRPFGWDDLCA